MNKIDQIKKVIKEIVLHVKPTKDESVAFAIEMKNRFPQKQDYGYGEAGYTLNYWQSIKALFLAVGMTTAAKKSHTQISQRYRKIVGSVIDDIIAESFIGNSYLGKCCWSGTVDVFLRSDKVSWLKQMIAHYKDDVSPYDLSASQKEAWDKCYAPLRKAFSVHIDKYKNLLLVFEYALPGRVSKKQATRLFWPDVLLVAKEKILVIEFKNKPLKENAIVEYLSQVNEYKRRLEKYHKESANKQIDCILVSTKMTKTKMILDDGIFCSGDNLDLIILNAFPKREEEFDYQIWLNSGYVGL